VDKEGDTDIDLGIGMIANPWLRLFEARTILAFDADECLFGRTMLERQHCFID
jgi:hypothetical protein